MSWHIKGVKHGPKATTEYQLKHENGTVGIIIYKSERAAKKEARAYAKKGLRCYPIPYVPQSTRTEEDREIKSLCLIKRIANIQLWEEIVAYRMRAKLNSAPTDPDPDYVLNQHATLEACIIQAREILK